VLSEVGKVASKVIIAEPSPKGCELYEKYANLWHEAMHSIGKFEDYQPLSYWINLMKTCGLIPEYSKGVRAK
jgi:hypothetical protein